MPGYEMRETPSRWYIVSPDDEVLDDFAFYPGYEMVQGIAEGTYPKGSYIECD